MDRGKQFTMTEALILAASKMARCMDKEHFSIQTVPNMRDAFREIETMVTEKELNKMGEYMKASIKMVKPTIPMQPTPTKMEEREESIMKMESSSSGIIES